MLSWWYTLTTSQQVFACIGAAATVALVIQIVLMLVGLAGSADGNVANAPDLDTAVQFEIEVDGVADIDLDASPQGIEEFGANFANAPEDALGIDEIEVPKSGGLRLFTMQGLVAFFAIFGWSGLVILKAGLGLVLAAPLAALFGFAAMLFMAMVLASMLKLQQDGTMDIHNCIDKTGTVYLPIYPNRTQKGKVSVLSQQRLAEWDAVTDDDQKLPTGTAVRIVGTAPENTLIVTAKSPT